MSTHRTDVSDVSIRARRLVEARGGRFSTEMGIDVDRGAGEIERWLLAATLFGTRISAAIAVRAYRLLAGSGVATLADIDAWNTHELVELLDRGGYARYDYRTALRLKKLAAALRGLRIDELGAGSLGDRHAALDALPGWGPVTVSLFLRELRGVWLDVDPPLDDRAAQAAQHVGLLDGQDQPLERLRAVAGQAGLDLRDLEASLIRLWLAHHRELPGCGGGRRCSALPDEPPGS